MNPHNLMRTLIPTQLIKYLPLPIFPEVLTHTHTSPMCLRTTDKVRPRKRIEGKAVLCRYLEKKSREVKDERIVETRE